MKLTFKEWLMFMLGFGYVANSNTKEIHRIETKRVNCRLDMITKKKYITGKEAYRLLNYHHYDEGWNGCRYCFHEQDKG